MSVTTEGFGLVIEFMEHLYTHLVTTSTYNSLASVHTLRITVTAAYIKHFMSSLVVSW
jgi:hypothetical protein